MRHKQINFVFCNHNFFIFSLYIAHWQPAELLCNSTRNKKNRFTHFDLIINLVYSFVRYTGSSYPRKKKADKIIFYV